MAVLDEEKSIEDKNKTSKKTEKIAGKVENSSRSFQMDLGLKLDDFVGSWTDSDLEKIVSYLKEWNTNAKHSFVSQAVLNR